MAFWNIPATPISVIPAGVTAPADFIFQNTGSNTIYVSDQQNVTADATSLAIAAGTPFTWSKSDPLYAVCGAGNPSTLIGFANGAQVGTSIAALLTPTAQYVVAALANQLYKSAYTLLNAIYTITCPVGVNTHIDFYDVNSNLITSVVTAAGTITVNLATNATQFDYWTDSGANTQIAIVKSGSNIPFVSGTLTTVTVTSTPGLVGDAYVVVVGGGGGGGGSSSGGGGGSGGITGGRVKLLGNELVTIGSLGAGGISGAVGVAGGNTSFAGFIATGGGGGQVSTGAGGVAGTPNGGVGAKYNTNGATASALSSSIFLFFNQGTTGGGGTFAFTAGSGLGIGTGGTGGAAVTNATGYGAGGGGSTTGAGGNGSPGVCYIVI